MAFVTPFFLGLTGAGGLTAFGIVAAGGVGSFAFGLGSFLGGTFLGRLLLSAGLNALSSALLRSGRPDRPNGRTIDDARVNSRIPTPLRWIAAGTVAIGGEAGIFAEHDGDGNFWYIIAHADAEITNTPTYILDDIEVTLSDGTDGFTAGDVLTDEFCLNGDNNQYEGSGTKVPIFRLYTVTPTSSADYGAKPSAFTSAFSDLPDNFLGVGVSYTIIRCKALEIEHRAKAYRWRGPIGIGEPSIGIVANFDRMYDPRESGHDINDSTTWTASDGNPVIIWAWFRTHIQGRNRSTSEINWDKVAEAANVCDETVLNRSGVSVPLYRCGIAIASDKPRHIAEAEILLTCDGFVAYDGEGKAYVEVGEYKAPTISFTAQRDILGAETEILNDGENAVDGVIVYYISPDHGYTKQPCAPWQNSIYYDGSREPNYRSIDILACQDHNQAVRLAKTIGLRSGAEKQVGITTTVKGVLAKGVRTIDLALDSEFTGDYEIVSPVEEDPEGRAAGFAVVPMQTDRYRLASGEEGAPPSPAPSLNIDNSLAAASNVVVTAERVTTETGSGVRLAATFDAPSRVDRFYRFRYAEDGQTVYEYFTVDMAETRAYSAIVNDGQDYDVQYQTFTAGGRASDWSSIVNVTATANPTAPNDLTAANAVAGGSAGEIDYSWTTANDANQYSVALYRGATATFGSATKITTILSGANDTGAFTETGVSAGTVYCWIAPLNGSGVEGSESGPYTVTVA